jgi:pyruvate formate lyase activating enzyme
VLPGTKAYSIAVAGCNFRCKNCQNYTISQANPLETQNEYLPPAEVVSRARAAGCVSIAYTYSEPTVWFEYMYDTAKLARSAGLKNILVSCGYINQPPLLDLCQYLDAANIDLKGFSESVYSKLNSGRLQPVLDTITTLIGHGVWVEVGTLIVPQWSDSSDDLAKMTTWVKNSFGADVPLHFLRFFPMFQLADLYPTPQTTLTKAISLAAQAGLHYAYAGNVAEMDSGTYCPNCKKLVVGRNGYVVTKLAVNGGKCKFCGGKIAGIWA